MLLMYLRSKEMGFRKLYSQSSLVRLIFLISTPEPLRFRQCLQVATYLLGLQRKTQEKALYLIHQTRVIQPFIHRDCKISLDRARLYASLLEGEKSSKWGKLIFDVYMDSIPVLTQDGYQGIVQNLINRCYRISTSEDKEQSYELVQRWIKMQLERIQKGEIEGQGAIHALESCYASLNQIQNKDQEATTLIKKVVVQICKLYLLENRAQTAMQSIEALQLKWNLHTDQEVNSIKINVCTQLRNFSLLKQSILSLTNLEEEPHLEYILYAIQSLINLYLAPELESDQKLSVMEMIQSLFGSHVALIQKGVIYIFVEMVQASKYNFSGEDRVKDDLIIGVVGLETIIVEATRPYNKKESQQVYKQMWDKGSERYQSGFLSSGESFFKVALLYADQIQSSKTARMLAVCCLRQNQYQKRKKSKNAKAKKNNQ
eukprot:TRINITY_DN8353_c0_g1_i7.p1 TRINITY_DN8353_c0_g1~~TRINITY_DN8353_c0_g1_i7.p1  ORF type:complete len:430 (-),score=26.42 TRINITY_DN8353_c0_g1_i7:110-1399(-)